MAPCYTQVGARYRAWEEIGATPWLVRQIRFGIQLPWTGPCRFQHRSSYDLSPAHQKFAREEVQRWLSLGYVRKANPSQGRRLAQRGMVAPAFVSEGRKPRLVIDYSVVNESLDQRTFRMDQLGDLAAVLHPRDRLFKADITDAYYHLRLRRSDQERLSFMVDGEVYVPLCLNCGLSVAPWFFTKAMRPVVAFLRARGHRVFSYLDDFFGAARPSSIGPASREDTQMLGQEMRSLFTRLGLALHPDKCDFGGKRQLEILGIVVDTDRALFVLSPAKLRKVEGHARRLLRYASRNKRCVKATDIRQFAGLGNSVSPAVVDARLRLRELFNALADGMTNVTSTCHGHVASLGQSERSRCHGASNGARSATKGRRRLSHAAMRDLQWWARLSCNQHVGRAVWPQVDARIFTDASMSGWGATWNGLVPVAGFFGEQEEGAHINELEVLAALFALKSFISHARHRSIELVTDSKVTEHIVRNYTSRSPRLLARLRQLRELCEANGVTVSTRHIPSVLNTWADRLSRRRDSHAWDLPNAAVRLLERRFAMQLHPVDGNELPTFTAMRAIPVVLPRPAMLPVWARHLARLGRGILVTPAWRTQAWFSAALRGGATEFPVDNGGAGKPLTTPWQTVALQFGRMAHAGGHAQEGMRHGACYRRPMGPAMRHA